MEATPNLGKKGVGGQGHFSDFRGERQLRMLTSSASGEQLPSLGQSQGRGPSGTAQQSTDRKSVV